MQLSLVATVLCLLVNAGMAVDQRPRLRARSGHAALLQLPTEGEHPANIEGMVEDLARMSAKDGATPGIDTFVKQIEKMVNEEMKPKITQQHDEAVLLVNGLLEPFNMCGTQKQQNDLDVTAAVTARGQRSEAHKTCRVNEGAAMSTKKTCDDTLELLQSAKDAQCNNPTLTEVPDGSVCHPAPGATVELWVAANAIMFNEKHVAIKNIIGECDKNTELFNQKKIECDARDAEYTSAATACDVEQTSLESAACAQAEQTTGSCESYTTCYQNALTGLNNAKPAIEAQVKDRKGEWRGLLRIQCLFGVFADGQGKGVDVAQIDSCKAITHDTSHLDIAFPLPPVQSPCAVMGSEPCTAAYTTEEYGGLPVNAQPQTCVPCAWNAPTTAPQQQQQNGVLSWLGANPTVTLGVCQGDCDTNSDCQSGLACFRRTGPCVVPGCSGTCNSDKTDYCVPAQGKLEWLGSNPKVMLGLCQGDCDNDSDCGSGLKCFQRNTQSGACSVPLCSGTCNSKNTDYCVTA